MIFSLKPRTKVMKKCFLYFALLFSVSSVIAQNTLYFEDFETLSQKVDISKKTPDKLNKLIDPAFCLFSHLSGFGRGHLQFGYVGFMQSFFVGDFYDGMHNRFNDDFDYRKELSNIQEVIFSNKAFIEPLYASVIPLYKDVFARMSPTEQQAFLQVLNKGISYADTFNLAKENEFLKEHNIAYEKGKMAAFLYRRISKNQLSAKECIYWLRKIKDDLASAVKVKSNPEDDFTIITEVKNNIYLAEVFNSEPIRQKLYLKDKNSFIPLGPEGQYVWLSFKEEYCQMMYNNGKSELFFLPLTDVKSKEDLIFYETEGRISQLFFHKENLILVYENGSYEIIMNFKKDKSQAKRIKTNKKQQPVLMADIVEDFLYINYNDGSSDLLFLKSQEQQNKIISIDDEVLNIIELENGYHVKYKKGKNFYLGIYGSLVKIVGLPDKYHYVDVKKWNNFLIFSIENPNNEPDFINEMFEYWYGAMDLNANIVVEPIYRNYSIVQNLNFFLFSADVNGKSRFAIYDYHMNKLTEPEFSFNYSINLTEFGEVETTVDNEIDYGDYSLIMLKHLSENEEKTSYLKILISRRKISIPAKWPEINRVKVNGDNFYLVNNKAKPNRLIMEPTGKLAIFNSEGTQLTKFKYDAIYPVSYYLEGVIGKKKVKINKEGKEFK